MADNRFWRWYDRGSRADFGGTLLGLVFDWKAWIVTIFAGSGGVLTFLLAAIRGRDPLDVWVFALVVTASLMVIVYLAISLLEKLLRKRSGGRSEASDSLSTGNEFADDVPDVRIADDAAVLGLFEITKDRDKLIPLLEAGKLQAWGRLGEGNPPPTKISADKWATCYLDHRPAVSPGTINQTYFRPKARPYESTYYDVHLNRSRLKRAWPNLWEPAPSLVDAESVKLAGIVGALMETALSWSFKLPLPTDDIWIKRFAELKDSAHPIWTKTEARQLRREFIQYCGIVGQPLGNMHETVSDRKELGQFGRKLIALLKGEPCEEWSGSATQPSLDRIPVTELLRMATERGWNFTDQHSLQLIDLQDAIRQGGLDGHLAVWGKLNRWPNAEQLMRKEVTEKIPADHWREFRVHLFGALDNDNFRTYSWHVRPSSATELKYIDLHVNRPEAAIWLDRDAVAFRGKTTSETRGP